MTSAENDRLTSGFVATATTLVVSYGSAIGTTFLKSFWQQFGINPFQFASASDLLIVGLTGVGATLVAVAIAALFGSILGERAVSLAKRFPRLPLVGLVLVLTGMAVLAFFVSYGIWLIIGMLGTWLLLWALHRSPEVPAWIKSWKSLPLIAVLIVYMPIAAHYFGSREGDRIVSSGRMVNIERSSLPLSLDHPVRFIGRIGSDYFLYEVATNSVAVVPASEDMQLVLVRVSTTQPPRPRPR